MVRGGDGDGIDLIGHLIQHHAEVCEPARVLEPFSIGRLLGCAGESGAAALLVDVAEGNELLVGETGHRGAPAAASADKGDAQAIVGGFGALAAQATREDEKGAAYSAGG